MGAGQTALVLGAIVLMAALILNVNRSILTSTDVTLDSEAIVAATNAGQQIIDAISSKNYDENTIAAEVTDVTGFTTVASLGPETGETINNFDDVDDFNNYSTVISTPRMGNFNIAVTVSYVSVTSPDVVIPSRTRTKRSVVSVTGDMLPDTLQLFYYSSY